MIQLTPEILDPLRLPALIVAVPTAAMALARTVLWVRQVITPLPREANGTGDWRANTAAAMTALTGATAHLTQAVRDIGIKVSDIQGRGATMEARLASLATREDLNLVAEKNRHATRGELQILVGQLDELQALIQRHDAWERGRIAAQGGGT